MRYRQSKEHATFPEQNGTEEPRNGTEQSTVDTISFFIFTVVNNIHNQKNKIYGDKSKILYCVLLVTLKILLGMLNVLLITLKILLAIVKSQCPTILVQIYISPIWYRIMFSSNKIRKVWVFLADFYWKSCWNVIICLRPALLSLRISIRKSIHFLHCLIIILHTPLCFNGMNVTILLHV